MVTLLVIVCCSLVARLFAVCLFVCSFVRFFVVLLVPSFVGLFVRSSVRSFAFLFLRLLVCLFGYFLVNSHFICSFV